MRSSTSSGVGGRCPAASSRACIASRVASTSGKEPRASGDSARTSTSAPLGNSSGSCNRTVSGDTNTPRTLIRLIVPHDTQLFFAGATDFNGAITPNSHLRWQSPLGEAGSIMGSSATYWCACRRVGSEPSGLPESSAGARSAGVHPRRRTALRVSQFLYRPPRQRWLLLLAALQVLLLSRERLEPELPVGC